MSAPPLHPQNNTSYHGPVTERRGSPVVYVPETPPAAANPQNVVYADANAPHATATNAPPLTPIVINETIDYPTPPPPSIPLRVRPARLDASGRTVGNGVEEHPGGATTTQVEALRVQNTKTRLAPAVSTTSTNRPEMADEGSSTAVEEPVSSPINVSFSSSIAPSATPSPSVRAANFRARTGSDRTARGAGTNVRDDTAAPIVPRSLASFTLPSSPGLPDAPPGLASRHQHSTTHGVQLGGDDEYFRYFATPPTFADPPPPQAQRLEQLPQTHPEHHEDASGAQNSLHRLEDDAARAAQDDPRTARKRFWAGTPDPEGEERALRRLRPTGTTPSFRDGTRLPSSNYLGLNPWASDHTIGTNATVNAPLPGRFSPAAASTPMPSITSLAEPPRTQLPSRCDSATAGTPQSLAMPRPRRDDLERSIGTHASPSAMSLDEDEARESETRSTTPPRPRTDKGKARATTEDIAHHNEDAADEHLSDDERFSNDGAAMDEEWSERDLARARQESLRQALQDRAGLSAATRRDHRARTNEAGPSRYEQHASASREEAHYRSRHDASSYHAPTRLPSEFLPLPNTRAANYLADRVHETRAMPQRSPPSRVQGLSRSTSPPLAPYGDPSFYGAADSGRQARTFWEDANRDDASRMDEENHDASFSERRGDRWDSQMRDGRDWREDEGDEAVPTCLREGETRSNTLPTPAPYEGFPPLHRDDPESALRGMALGWIREIWQDDPNSDVLVQVYNYRYTEDDALNRRVAEALRWAFEQISGESGFDVVPPELEDGTRARGRDLPSIWAIRGLSSTSTLMATARGTWSFNRISFIALPRSTTPQDWLFALDGYLEGNADKIRQSVLRVLQEESMRSWIADMLAVNPAFAGWSPNRAMEEFLNTLRVDVLQLENGNYFANVHIRPPTRNLRDWRMWVSELRTRRYRSFAIGTGRVRPAVPCSGCTSVAHPSHICPLPRIRGWNGPRPGEGVFGERAGTHRGGAARRTNTPPRMATWEAGRGRRRDEAARNSPWNANRSRQESYGPQWNGRSERGGRAGRGDRTTRSSRGDRHDRRDHGSRNERDDRGERNGQNGWHDRSGPSKNGRSSGSGGRKRF
ncbi:hypothetical protein OH76DRAFT_1489138 [Lentinus brumalis]|uniref:Uncharacterized protein n=1 Tax=Lentinus brumalis TaxID=2498619 RepID=A0A371CNL6_9APHY|nr:hypothetical protein OH76DRAFT_1489138 [Polyporus brumalis]